ncbi:glycosyltransferase family 4 protein [Salinimicrobium sp. CAU 1759]
MKVLIDNQVFEGQKFGGISRYFRELQNDNASIEQMPFFKQEPLQRNFYLRLKTRFNPFNKKKAAIGLSRENFYLEQIKNRNFDVFHPTYYDNYFLESIDKPFVLTVHDMIHERFPEYFGSTPDSFNKRRLCDRAEKIIAISETTKIDLIDIFGISESKIQVIYHGTSFDTLEVSKPQLEFKEERYILFTGNRSLYKNFLTFLIAVTPIIKDNKGLRLVCTGPDFNNIEKKWIKELGVAEKVHHYYCTNDNELAYLYKNAECFVFPSLYEGFGFPLLEAFAMNCPVLSSHGGSLKEIALDAAVFFNPKDIKEIRAKLSDILDDCTLKEELVLAGNKRLKDFSWSKCRKETLDVYKQLV